MPVGFELRGIEPAQQSLAGVAQRTRANLPGAMYRWAEGVMSLSKEGFVPVKTGALKASGRVTPPEWQGDQVSVDLVYGGPAAPYALDQHETPWYYHPVGQWKYLEQPLMQAAPTAAQSIAADLAWP